MRISHERKRTRVIQLVGTDGFFIIVETPCHVKTGLLGTLRCATCSAEDVTKRVTIVLEGHRGLHILRLALDLFYGI
jgi:hypothetical protein